jgi:hypothetical protein
LEPLAASSCAASTYSCAHEPGFGFYFGAHLTLQSPRLESRLTILGAALLLLPSCGSRSASSPTLDAGPPRRAPAADAALHHAKQAEAKTDEPPPDGGSPEDLAKRAEIAKTAKVLERALLGESGGCVTAIHQLGRDRKGQELLVVRLNGGEDCLAARPADGDEASNETKTEDEAKTEDGEERECAKADYHLVARKGRRVRDLALLASSCDMEADFPEPGDSVEVDVKSKTLTHSLSGGHTVIETTRVTVGLDPLRLVAIEESGYNRWTNGEDKRSWDWDNFSGTSTWDTPDCKATSARKRAAVPPDAGEDDDDEKSTSDVLIPSVSAPADFVANGWRATRLGACSAAIGGTRYTIHGSPDADTGVRAVVANDTLFVEVSDDRFVGPGSNWVKDDHLELWLGTDVPEGAKPCDGTGLVQWGIRVADGAIFSAHGSPKPLVGVER